jgi:hypothetical protein
MSTAYSVCPVRRRHRAAHTCGPFSRLKATYRSSLAHHWRYVQMPVYQETLLLPFAMSPMLSTPPNLPDVPPPEERCAEPVSLAGMRSRAGAWERVTRRGHSRKAPRRKRRKCNLLRRRNRPPARRKASVTQPIPQNRTCLNRNGAFASSTIEARSRIRRVPILLGAAPPKPPFQPPRAGARGKVCELSWILSFLRHGAGHGNIVTCRSNCGRQYGGTDPPK